MKLQYAVLLPVLALSCTQALASDIVVVGHPSAAALTKEQVTDVFLGRNLSLSPVDQPEGSPIYADFYKRAAGREPAQVKAIWTRLLFTGKAQAPRQAADAAAVKKAVAADPKAIGYIDKSTVDGSVKVLLTLD